MPGCICIEGRCGRRGARRGLGQLARQAMVLMMALLFSSALGVQADYMGLSSQPSYRMLGRLGHELLNAAGTLCDSAPSTQLRSISLAVSYCFFAHRLAAMLCYGSRWVDSLSPLQVRTLEFGPVPAPRACQLCNNRAQFLSL